MLSPSEAFQIAVPRRPAVLCLKRGEETQLIAVSWFTWLNMRRQPMISYAMERSAALGLDLQENDELYLAFPEPRAVEGFKAGLHARPAPEGQDDEADSRVTNQYGLPVILPAGTEIELRCTLARAYNYPFKKVRIFNCNFEDAQHIGKRKK